MEDDDEREEVEEENGLAAPEGGGLAFLSELPGDPEADPDMGVWAAGGDWLGGLFSA